MRIGSLKLSTIQGGAYHGTTSFYLNMRDLEKPKDVTKPELLHEVSSLRDSMRLVNAGFIVIAEPDQQQDLDVREVVRTVAEYGLIPIVYCTGENRPLYYDDCKWSRVQRYVSRLGENWMEFNVNEFELIAYGTLPGHEPAMSRNNMGADRILTLSKREKPEEVLQWIGEAQYPWRIVYPAIRDVEVVLI